MASKYLQKFPIPAGFQQILADFTKEVLRDQPSNIIQYAAQYFEMLQKGKKLEFNSKYNVKKDDKKYQLAYNPKNAEDITKKAANITQKINNRAIQKQEHQQTKIAPPVQKHTIQTNTAPVHHAPQHTHVKQQTHISQQVHHHSSAIGTQKTVTGQETGNYINHLSHQVAEHQNQNIQEQAEEEQPIISAEEQQMEAALKQAISTTVNLVFEKYDANNSGFLQSKEINKFVKEVIAEMNQGVVPSQEEIQEFVRQVDNDHDGKISREELQSFVGGLMGL